MIIKIQRPMATTDSIEVWLLYSQFREIELLVTGNLMPLRVLDAMGNDPKAYFDAEVNDKKELTIGKRVKSQPW